MIKINYYYKKFEKIERFFKKMASERNARDAYLTDDEKPIKNSIQDVSRLRSKRSDNYTSSESWNILDDLINIVRKVISIVGFGEISCKYCLGDKRNDTKTRK